MGRNRKIITAIGQPGVGKSTNLEEMFSVRVDLFSEPLAILDYNEQSLWQKYPEVGLDRFAVMKKGTYRIKSEDWRDFYKTAKKFYRDGCILAEDAYYLPEKKDDDIYAILTGLRHQSVDLGFTTHSIADTPKFLLRQSNEILLWKTGDVWKDIQDRVRDDKKEELKKAFDEVNADPDEHAFRRIILIKTGTK